MTNKRKHQSWFNGSTTLKLIGNYAQKLDLLELFY